MVIRRCEGWTLLAHRQARGRYRLDSSVCVCASSAQLAGSIGLGLELSVDLGVD